MEDPTALYSLISGIGGALIGGTAGVYGPARINSQRRLDEGRAQERAAAAEERRLQAEENQKALSAISDATVALQGWHRLITRTLQDLEVRREVDVARFDESAEPVMHSVVEAISLVSNEAFRSMRWSRHIRDLSEDGDVRQPVTRAMHELTLGLRRQLIAPQPGFNVNDSIAERAHTIRNDVMHIFMAERELRVGPPIFAGAFVVGNLRTSPNSDRG